MTVLDQEGASRRLVRLREAVGGGWVDLFVERRCVLHIAASDSQGPTRTESWDQGIAIRLVASNGRSIQASSTGVGLEVLEAAEQSLLRATGRSGSLPPSLGGKAGNPNTLSVSYSGFDAWLAEEETGLKMLTERLASLLSRVSIRDLRLTLEMTASRQEISQVSSSSPIVNDVRRGVLAMVRVSGGGGMIHRRWAGESAGALMGRIDLRAEVAAIEEALHRITEVSLHPCGEFPVVFANSSSGMLIHEAIGHHLEGDLLGAGRSILAERSGSVLSPLITVVEDPLSYRGRSSYRHDDEGMAARRTVLVENGRPIGSIGDLWNSEATTGHGRRQSHRDTPLPRLASTICLSGPHDPAEIVADTTRGILVDQIRSGFTDPASGEFVLHAVEGRLIEGGRLTAGVRDLLVMGDVRTSISLIDRLGDDLAHDGGTHSCVRAGQAVVTIVGAPTLRIARLSVAGMNVA